MKHKHHIVPRHMGGSDDPSNLVEMTVEEHAEAHKKLYEEHGHIEDYCAWKGLSGQIGKEEIMRLLMDPTGRVHTEETKQKISEAHKGKPKHTEESKEKLRQFRTGTKQSEETKRKIGEAGLGNKRCVGNKLTEEHKENLSKSMKGNKNACGPQKVSEETKRNRSEASKERWRKYREAKGLDPDKPIDKRYG